MVLILPLLPKVGAAKTRAGCRKVRVLTALCTSLCVSCSGLLSHRRSRRNAVPPEEEHDTLPQAIKSR